MSSEIFQVLRCSKEINMEMEEYRERFLSCQKQNELLSQEIAKLTNEKKQLTQKIKWYRVEVQGLSVKSLDMVKKYLQQEKEKGQMEELIEKQNSEIDLMTKEIKDLKCKCETLEKQNKLWLSRIQITEEGLSSDEENENKENNISNDVKKSPKNNEKKLMNPSKALQEICKQSSQKKGNKKSFNSELQQRKEKNIDKVQEEISENNIADRQEKISQRPIISCKQLLLYIEEYLMNVAINAQEKGKGSSYEVGQYVGKKIEKRKKKIKDFLDQFKIQCEENEHGLIWGFWARLFCTTK